jgi:hypothetical protein
MIIFILKSHHRVFPHNNNNNILYCPIMRQRVGVKGRANGLDAYKKKAQEMKTISYQSAIEMVEKLERKLTDFAVRHKHEIQTDASFRSMFLQMCAPLSVDPLVSSKKKATKGGLWAMLGLGLEEFYAELSRWQKYV